MNHDPLPLSAYQDIAPLCQKGHVVLVKNKVDGMLYVKKYLNNCSPELFIHLKQSAVENTPEIHGLYTAGSCLIVIEEYLAGNTLAERLEQDGMLSEKETIQIALQLCRILQNLHSLNPAVIHRDIKPSDILLSPDGSVKLLDFNAAKLHTAVNSRDTVLLGTEGYAAPEQYGFSSSSYQTDIYAVGVLINVCLTGRMPAQWLAEGKLQRIIRRCTELDPKDRYCSAKELAQALKRASKMKIEWLPPGFRTLRPHKMVIALIWYMLFAAFLFSIRPGDFDDPTTYISMRVAFVAMGLLTVAFCTDYMGIRKYFPFMRSQKPVLRILGAVLALFLIFWAGILLSTILELWFFP